jgi:hypothetical protein
MAGLFDFKSAEDILKERQDATRKNVMEAFNQPGQYKVRGERTANAVGKILGLLGGQLFADSPEEQVAGQMQRANQLAQSLKPVEGESQSQFYNRVAESFNDAGYSQNALKALTLSKQAQVEEEKETQRQREFQVKLNYERGKDAYERKRDEDKEAQGQIGREAEAAYAKQLGAPPEVQKAIIGNSMSVKDWMQSKKIGEEEQSAAEKKMNELIAGGVSEDNAFELVYGTTKIFTDPTTGALTKIDLVGNTPPITIASGNKEFIRINNGVTELSSALTRADILANKPVWEQVKENIIDKGKDIPGLGFVGSKIPGFASDPEEVRNKQLVAQLQNITLKNRSGASVSTPEFERLKTELATGSFNTEREKMIAINRMYEIAQAHEKGIRAGYGADINKEFDARWNSFESPKNSLPPSGGEGDTTSGGLTPEATEYFGGA